jgi:lysozyme
MWLTEDYQSVVNKVLAVEIAVILAKPFEGLMLKPYLCPAGVATIGYGSTRYEDGTRVTLFDMPITKTQAENLLINSIQTEYLPAVIRLCPEITDPYRLAAIIDFAYNLGPNNLKHSTLRRKINEDNWDSVPDQLRRWVRGGGKVLKGLVARREAEVRLI